jgi:nitroreductase
MLKDLVLKSRSYRRFDEQHDISADDLKKLIDMARLSPSASNLQPLKYILVNDRKINDDVFSCLIWAAALKEWKGPVEGERPSAYVVILSDSKIRKHIPADHGIAAQTIMLGAAEKGLGGCMLMAINKKQLRTKLQIDERYDILMVLALGKPAEDIVLEEMQDGKNDYWRDDEGKHHVPKRSLDEIIVTVN